MKKQKKKSVFRRFLKYIRPYWFLFTLAAVGGIIKFTIPLVFPQIIPYFIDVVLAEDSPDSSLL